MKLVNLSLRQRKVVSTPEVMEPQDYIDCIKAELPYQKRLVDAKKEQELIEAEFGLSYSESEMRRNILDTLPWYKDEDTYSVSWSFIRDYTGHIPDTALIRYDEAKKTGKFGAFQVWYLERRRRYVDPWLIGVIQTSKESRFIPLAYWD